MSRTDDPIHDFLRHDAEVQSRLDKLPKCCECGEPIQDEFAFVINDEWICEECLNANYRKPIEDYID